MWKWGKFGKRIWGKKCKGGKQDWAQNLREHSNWSGGGERYENEPVHTEMEQSDKQEKSQGSIILPVPRNVKVSGKGWGNAAQQMTDAEEGRKMEIRP